MPSGLITKILDLRPIFRYQIEKVFKQKLNLLSKIEIFKNNIFQYEDKRPYEFLIVVDRYQNFSKHIF